MAKKVRESFDINFTEVSESSQSKYFIDSYVKDDRQMYFEAILATATVNGNNFKFTEQGLKDNYESIVGMPVKAYIAGGMFTTHKDRVIGYVRDAKFVKADDLSPARVVIGAVIWKNKFDGDANLLEEFFNNNGISVSMECEYLQKDEIMDGNIRSPSAFRFVGVQIVNRPADELAQILAIAEKAVLDEETEDPTEEELLKESSVEVTKNFIHIPVATKLKTDDIKTIQITKDVKALYALNRKVILTYLFSTNSYDLKKAKKWVKDHKLSKKAKSEIENADSIDNWVGSSDILNENNICELGIGLDYFDFVVVSLQEKYSPFSNKVVLWSEIKMADSLVVLKPTDLNVDAGGEINIKRFSENRFQLDAICYNLSDPSNYIGEGTDLFNHYAIWLVKKDGAMIGICSLNQDRIDNQDVPNGPMEVDSEKIDKQLHKENIDNFLNTIHMEKQTFISSLVEQIFNFINTNNMDKDTLVFNAEKEIAAGMPKSVADRVKELIKSGKTAKDAMKQAWDEYKKSSKAEDEEIVVPEVILDAEPIIVPETPIETPIETPVEVVPEVPVETPVETPVEIVPETPIETPVETPVEVIPEVAPVEEAETIQMKLDNMMKENDKLKEEIKKMKSKDMKAERFGKLNGIKEMTKEEVEQYANIDEVEEKDFELMLVKRENEVLKESKSEKSEIVKQKEEASINLGQQKVSSIGDLAKSFIALKK